MLQAAVEKAHFAFSVHGQSTTFSYVQNCLQLDYVFFSTSVFILPMLVDVHNTL